MKIMEQEEVDLQHMVVGEQGKIVGYRKGGDKAYRQKLLAMGLTPGTQFQLVRVAPLGDPIQLHVRGFNLTLRKSEAGVLRVERVLS